MSDNDASAQTVPTGAARATRSRLEATARAARIARSRKLEQLSARYLSPLASVERVHERSAARRAKFEESEAARVASELESIEAKRADILHSVRALEGVTARDVADYFGLSRKEAAALLASEE